MADILFELQQKVAMKPALEAKLRELQNQRREYDREVISLRVAFRQEQEDVEKLEGRSLANYFFQVVGKLDEKLDQERREAYAAKVKLDAAERELAGIEADISEIQTQLNEIRVAEVQYKEELEKKRAMLKASGTAAADQIIEIEQKIAALEAQKREIKEAISAGYSARSTADRILSELESADGWNTWDMFGDYNDGYAGTPNHYRDGMGLFGRVYKGTVKNLTVENFTKSDCAKVVNLGKIHALRTQGLAECEIINRGTIEHLSCQ